MNAQNKTTKVTANFGAKGWLLMLFSFACIFIDSSLINDSLNVTREVFAGTTGMNYGVLSMFSTVGGWIAVAGGVLWGYIGAKKSARFAWTCSLAISRASVDSVPVPIRSDALPVLGSIRVTTPVRISCCLELNSS